MFTSKICSELRPITLVSNTLPNRTIFHIILGDFNAEGSKKKVRCRDIGKSPKHQRSLPILFYINTHQTREVNAISAMKAMSATCSLSIRSSCLLTKAYAISCACIMTSSALPALDKDFDSVLSDLQTEAILTLALLPLEGSSCQPINVDETDSKISWQMIGWISRFNPYFMDWMMDTNGTYIHPLITLYTTHIHCITPFFIFALSS